MKKEIIEENGFISVKLSDTNSALSFINEVTKKIGQEKIKDIFLGMDINVPSISFSTDGFNKHVRQLI